MANLVAIAYDDMNQAESVMRSIGELVKEHSLTLEDAVIVEHKDNGKLKLHQPSLVGIGAASGALWGGVIGLLFLAPVLGMAVGAAAGAAGGAARDYGVDDDFVKELGEQLPRGALRWSCWCRSRLGTRSCPRSRSTEGVSSRAPSRTTKRRHSSRRSTTGPL